MLRDAITRIDILHVFNWFGIVMGGIVALGIAATFALMIEPSNLVGNRHLDVLVTTSGQDSMRPRSRFIQRETLVVLPNGNETTFMLYDKQISPQNTVCATIKIGRWTNSYHVEIVAPDECW